LEVKVSDELSTTMKGTSQKGVCGTTDLSMPTSRLGLKLYHLKIKYMFCGQIGSWQRNRGDNRDISHYPLIVVTILSGF
jgi:hypothetical protein